MNKETEGQSLKSNIDISNDISNADAADKAHLDFSKSLSYGDYLQLDILKSAHRPVTKAHNEHLFIAIHHVSEVWIDLIIRELQPAMQMLENGITESPLKALSRVVRIQEQLTNSWEVLKTMTPTDYLTFRDAFGQASGFQSAGYRMIEVLLGNRNPVLLRPHEHRPDLHGPLNDALHRPSIYDLALRLMVNAGLEVPSEVLKRNFTQKYEMNEVVLQSWVKVYQQTEKYWELYELAEKLIDVEDQFRRWRFNHLTTVERTIGFKRGSGGTSGAGYLRQALNVVLFPELWEVRTRL